MRDSRAVLEFKGIKSSPVSNNSTTRSVIKQMCKTLKLNFDRIADNNGYLDKSDQVKAQQALRRNPNCRIKLVVIR